MPNGSKEVAKVAGSSTASSTIAGRKVELIIADTGAAVRPPSHRRRDLVDFGREAMEAVEGWGAAEGWGKAADGAGGGASRKDLETMFQLIFLRFTAPRPDPVMFQTILTQSQAMLANQAAQPEYAFFTTLT